MVAFGQASAIASLALCSLYWSSFTGLVQSQTAILSVDASRELGRRISDTLFGVSFEEINHAGAGGLWSELVSNRGFEAGGQVTPSNIEPWSIIGNDSSIYVSTDRSSGFDHNKVALRMEVLCDSEGGNKCPSGGVGIYNPGYWGMNIEKGKSYKVVLHVRSLKSVNVSASLTSSDGSQDLATYHIVSAGCANWTKVEFELVASGTDHKARLELKSSEKGVTWFDQVSVVPVDTYKGHGFRKELASMVAELKPRFIRFPGGSFVEGEWLRDTFHWKDTVGPWEERPGRYNDVWKYWTDDGIGFFEFLQLAEDLGASPVWVFNNGISRQEEVETSSLFPFVQDALHGIEFARGSVDSKWGSVRAAMGHPEPFHLQHIALGNQDCGRKHYVGNYLKFYNAIHNAYPDIKVISNCDGFSHPLDHPAQLYDLHFYTSAMNLLAKAHQFDQTARTNSTGPKAFISEYAVTGNDAGKGSFLAALAVAGFLIGLEHNSDIVSMASYAPLFLNDNDRRFIPDAIVFNSWQQYGTPSYWVQHFFKESSGAILFPTTVQPNSLRFLSASAIFWQNPENDTSYIRIKVVNFESRPVNLNISVTGLEPTQFKSVSSLKTTFTSRNLKDENSFDEPEKIIPVQGVHENVGPNMNAVLGPNSFTSFDLLLEKPHLYHYAI